ncbi:Hsp70 family protein [Nonomuraea dietziae]|uniref:Molecular chaperone DnaK (HSP70) n=1 Tax=Nonomuraea dietziae TaxID=65515 RepID=A0A7W5V4T3_9ACTN|nr:Hsp70 family protein [Nonomuraea dietziae]MBB3727886.1 molecular chaperone DnaK (HSP70) [Nonomuraea dietziae]
MDDALHRVIGIDLGTTYSAVAAYNADEFESEIIYDGAIADRQGAATPSVVRLGPEDGRVIIGHEAKNAIGLQGAPAETIIEIKREMGAEFTEASLDAFGVRGEREVGQPVEVRFGGAWLRPQEVSALILMRMKEIAETRLGGQIRDAVVTVPAYFTERQKKATEEAALLAGLYPRQLIPEPTAAAICYGVDRGEAERQIYLVFDFGGGTFDVSIIETRDEEIVVLATAGDQRLGGGDIDDAIAAWAMEHSGGAGDPMRVKAAAEGAKRELSFSEQATMSLDDGVTLTLDRPTFEALARPVLDKTLAQVEEALRFAAEQKGLDRADVDAVLLVGGSTRIPRVTQMLLEYFDKDEEFVRSDGNPDTLVARGAAIVARKFEPSQEFDLARAEEGGLSDEADELKITLITEHTLGVAVQEGRFDPLISRGAKIPASQKKIYTNPPLAEHIEAAIYQGEGKYVYEDGTTLVGTIHLSDIEPRPEGYHNFEVEFALDINGLLEVRVKHVNTGRDYEATFEQSTSIGQVNELAERRQALLALYSGHDRLTPRQAAAPTPAPSSAIPRPVDDDEPALDLGQVPREFTRLVRRVHDHLDKERGPLSLVAAYEDFASAIRSGAPEHVLEELGDRLEEAFDARR